MLRGRTVGHWYDPVTALEQFGDQEWVRRSKEARQREDAAYAELLSLNAQTRSRTVVPTSPLTAEETPEEAEAREHIRRLQQRKHDAYQEARTLTDLLMEDLQEQLARGELIARGFTEPSSPGAPYLTISRHEWQILKLNLQGGPAARGWGVGYVGLTIGKPGIRSFFRRRR
jgi:hypothetical protein